MPVHFVLVHIGGEDEKEHVCMDTGFRSLSVSHHEKLYVSSIVFLSHLASEDGLAVKARKCCILIPCILEQRARFWMR